MMDDLPRARLRFDFSEGRLTQVYVVIDDVDVATLGRICDGAHFDSPVNGPSFWRLSFLADIDPAGDPTRQTWR